MRSCVVAVCSVAVCSALALVVSAAEPPQGQLMVVAGRDHDEDHDEGHVEEVDEEDRKPIDPDKIFIPTEEWQTVQPDAVVLAGLHYRINMETGLREARLMDGDPGHQYLQAVERLRKSRGLGNTEGGEEGAAERMRQEILLALKNIKSEDGKTPEELIKEAETGKNKFRSYEELKRDMDALQLSVETDLEVVRRLVGQYGAATDEERLVLLEDLEYLVHQIDNAIAFKDLGGLESIVKPGLNSSSSGVVRGVLHLLGSAAQSNPQVQIAAVEAGLLHPLLQAVAQEGQDGVARKAVFALSCLVRGFPYGQQMLLAHGGLHTLRRVFDRNDWQSLPLQLKVVSLVHDMLVETRGAEGERLQQLSRMRLGDHVAEGGWCSAVSSLLAAASFDRRDIRYDMGAALRSGMPLRPDHDTVDKVVSAMGSMVGVCRQQFSGAVPLLRHLAQTYQDLAHKEQYQDHDDGGHDLFQGLHHVISNLLKEVSVKVEL